MRKLSKEAREAIERVAQAIEAEPELYSQSNYSDPKDPCGGACCIAGWAVWLNDVERFKLAANNQLFWREESRRALKHNVPSGMFSAEPFLEWPAPYNKQFGRAQTREERAKVAAAMLRNYIATDGEWNV